MTQKNKPTLIVIIACYIFLAGFITSCGSSKKIGTDYIYFRGGKDTVTTQQKETIIQPYDLLSIQVYSKMQNQEQAAIFNIPASSNNLPQGYQVNASGNIDMPVIGTIRVAALNKNQLQTLLEQRLVSYVKNPTVLVRFLEFTINVLGEVRAPGAHKFFVDRVTIIDAISAAGDLTDQGKRDDVTVIREENGKRIYYKVDLRNRDVFESNVYVLQPNDVVYVSPTRNKLRYLSADTETQRRIGLFFTITSFVIGIANFIIYSLK